MKKLCSEHLLKLFELIEAELRIFASVNQAIIALDDGFSPFRYQAIIWTNVGV